MKPEYILIRVGEQSLKSEQVWIIFNRILTRNIKAALKGIDYQMKIDLNRIFIFTKDTGKAVKRLQHVFGITSLSPAYICDSNIDEMKKLAKKIFKPGKKTFAIRARRSGSHPFTSMDIAKDVGWVIPGKVDLSDPEKELFIECRQNKTYMFTERIAGPGGLPLGASGKILGMLNNDEDLVACWMLMKRGCEIVPISRKKNLISKLKKWYIGPELKTLPKMPKKHDFPAIVTGEKSYEKLPKTDMLVLQPLVALDFSRILTQING